MPVNGDFIYYNNSGNCPVSSSIDGGGKGFFRNQLSANLIYEVNEYNNFSKFNGQVTTTTGCF